MSTPIQLSGTETFRASPQKVFDAVTDLDRMKALIPDLVSAERDPDGSLRCVVKPGFAFIRGTLKMNIRLVQATSPESAELHVSSSGIGMSMRMESTLRLTPKGDETQLDWTAAVVERKGLIAAVSAGLIRGAAEKTVKDGWEKLRAIAEA